MPLPLPSSLFGTENTLRVNGICCGRSHQSALCGDRLKPPAMRERFSASRRRMWSPMMPSPLHGVTDMPCNDVASDSDASSDCERPLTLESRGPPSSP